LKHFFRGSNNFAKKLQSAGARVSGEKMQPFHKLKFFEQLFMPSAGAGVSGPYNDDLLFIYY
jgi:hypothetical protein